MPNAAININGHYPLHWRYLLEAWPHQLHATKELTLASRLLEVFVSKKKLATYLGYALLTRGFLEQRKMPLLLPPSLPVYS